MATLVSHFQRSVSAQKDVAFNYSSILTIMKKDIYHLIVKFNRPHHLKCTVNQYMYICVHTHTLKFYSYLLKGTFLLHSIPGAKVLN